MKKIRVMLVDDQALFREGLRTLLNLLSDVEIVAEAKDGREAIEVAKKVRPDLILMDLRMPSLGGVEAIKGLKQAEVQVKTLVLTTFDTDEEIADALRAGAVGYLLKDLPSEKLAEAIRSAMRGDTVLEPRVAGKVVKQFVQLQGRGERRTVQPLVEPLSPRELQVVDHLACGLSNKEIAVKLGVAEGTVKNHLSQIFGKLGVLDRTQAALKARELGLF